MLGFFKIKIKFLIRFLEINFFNLFFNPVCRIKFFYLYFEYCNSDYKKKKINSNIN